MLACARSFPLGVVMAAVRTCGDKLACKKAVTRLVRSRGGGGGMPLPVVAAFARFVLEDELGPGPGPEAAPGRIDDIVLYSKM